MSIIQFNAVIGADQIIRPPAGIALPEGEIEVTIRTRSIPGQTADPLSSTRAWLLELAREAELAQPDLPVDMAENHDHYAHGKPRP